MPDREQPVSIIQNSLSAGEIAPGLYGRQDLAKVHQGAALMKNFFVDFKGGASTRPGTQYIGQAAGPGYVRLIPFKFSAAIGQTYMLVFSHQKLRFIKNPGGFRYPNSSNAGFITSGGVPYEIDTPYAEGDLPYIKVSQVADVMTITRHGYKRRNLNRLSDTNWTLTEITPSVGPASPTITSITATDVIDPDPGNTRYMYSVTAVDADGNESLPSPPYISAASLNISTTQGTVSIFWTAVGNAVFYRVYKAIPTPGGVLPSLAEQMGYIGFSYGTQFVDSNVVPDFTLTPPLANDPFANAQITGYTITASSGDWPTEGTGITVSDATGSGAIIYPILNNNKPGETGTITGLHIVNRGHDYTAPTLTATGGGTTFTATVTLSPSSGNNPDVVGLFQQRRIYASTANNPNTVFGSRPGDFDDFRVSNPIIDSDAYTFALASEQVDDIVWVQSMPGGLVIATNSGIVQLTGGSSTGGGTAAVTPANAVVVPQSFNGSADVPPVVIDYDILYVQSEGSIVRDLQYHLYYNIYTGTDVTILSSHLFYPQTIDSWTYQDTPYKVVWCVRHDGTLLSMTWLKSQEVIGWSRHETQGLVENVATVREGAEDALYLSVNRGGVRFIERLADRIYYQIDDAWCLDAALSTVSTYPVANLTTNGLTGTVTLTASSAVFGSGDVGKVIRSFGSKAVITGYISTTQVTANVLAQFGAFLIGNGYWRMDPVVGAVAGLDHLNGRSVMALADGVVQGPFTVTGGAITLPTPASQVVVGLPYQCQIQPLYIDVGGEQTIQGQLKKTTAATIRVKDSARIKFGSSAETVREWIPEHSTDPVEHWPDVGYGMWTGNLRAYVEPFWGRVGSVWVQQDYPLPCTVLAVINEMALGDTR